MSGVSRNAESNTGKDSISESDVLITVSQKAQKAPDAEYGAMQIEARYHNITEVHTISIAFPFYEQRLAWAKRRLRRKLLKRLTQIRLFHESAASNDHDGGSISG